MNLHLLLYGLTSLKIALGGSSSDPKKNELKNFKYPPCQSCKILAGSFKKGVEKTARGKLDGGDTDWEEKNKLSYSTSEIRFVEIMENICNEIDKGQHQCQSLAEEHEGLIEQFWRIERNDKILQNWLCIEKLQVCCADLHYGANCTPCSGYPGYVCSNNGKCKGSGTRKGNGQCSCNIGYEGETCDQCAASYFQSYKDDSKLLCSPCHQACEKTCLQAGPRGCLACKPGWSRDPQLGCLDINECLANMQPCSTNQFCVNSEGSFKCLSCDKSCSRCDGDGPDMCLQCADGFEMRNNICEDSSKHQSERSFNTARYVTYLGLCVATCIVFQRNTVIASLIGLVVAIYISVSEFMLSTGKASPQLNFNLGDAFPFI